MLYGRTQARRSLFDTIVFRAAGQVFTVLGYIVMVRAMSEHDFGVYNLLYAIIPVISIAASLGLEQTLRRYQPEYLQAGNIAAAARLVRIVASTRFVASVVVIGVLLLAWDRFAPFFKLGPYRAEFAIFGLLVVLYFQSRVLQLALASHMLHRYSVGAMTILSAGRFVAYGGLALLGALSLESAIWSDIVAYAASWLVLKWVHVTRCRSPEAARYRFEPADRKRMMKYAFFYNFNEAGALGLNMRAENFFLAAMLGPVAVGAYAFYSRLQQMANHLLPLRLFENVVNPLFFAIRKEDAAERVPRYFTTLMNTSLLVQMPMLAFTVAYHREIVAVLFGGKFIEQSWLLPLVMAFGTVNLIAIPVTLVAQYAEKASIILYSRVFALYNIAALLLLIPRAGVFGAALAIGSAELFKNLFIWWHVRHQARWVNMRTAVGTALTYWGLFIATIWLLRAVLGLPDIANLAIGVVLAMATGLLYLRSPALTSSDRRLFETVLHGREARILRRLGFFPAADSAHPNA
jgi:O-antigen/teichoic acid export membrane protein